MLRFCIIWTFCSSSRLVTTRGFCVTVHLLIVHSHFFTLVHVHAHLQPLTIIPAVRAHNSMAIPSDPSTPFLSIKMHAPAQHSAAKRTLYQWYTYKGPYVLHKHRGQTGHVFCINTDVCVETTFPFHDNLFSHGATFYIQ